MGALENKNGWAKKFPCLKPVPNLTSTVLTWEQ